MLQERSPQIGSVPDSAGRPPSLTANGVQVLAHKLRQVSARQVTPKIFDRVELRRVGRQVFRRQPMLLLSDPPLDLCPTVSRQPVPQQNYLPTTDVSLERLQVRQHLSLFHGSRFKTQTQPDPPGGRSGDQARHRRQTLPVERRHQDWRLTAWHPRSTDSGTFREAAFLQKNQQRPALPSFF